ncbi:MAG: DNA-3-methyladenine glycosylase 2 family protein [Saprospiraceae bacterium]|nr:DNA-3-methyladenine glycosylase 2 family protein [Saprospiraceae bacterium]MBP7679554.1 DNA-3-methyladenine glycosylase 2 family protein [Saprospiraceae bacterium]
MKNHIHIIQHLSNDAALNQVLMSIDLPDTKPSFDVYTDLVSSIISQQISTKAAQAVYRRFADLFPEQQPTPTLLATMPIETLRNAGLSQQKAAYVKNTAQFFIENSLLKDDWQQLSDNEIIGLLTRIKGVGVWTSQMILMFTLDRPDILPLDDLGIQHGFRKLYGLQEEGKLLKQRMVAIAEPWQPYRTYACRAIWKWKDNII